MWDIMEIINENVPGIRVSDVRSDKRPGAGVDSQRGNMRLSWKKVNTKGRKSPFNSQINSTQYIPRAIKIKIWRRFFTWILSSILVLGVEETKWARIVSGFGLTLIMVMQERWDGRFGEEILRFMLSFLWILASGRLLDLEDSDTLGLLLRCSTSPWHILLQD